jgi:hypothetical protein
MSAGSMSLLLQLQSRSIFLLRKNGRPPHQSGSHADPPRRCADHDSHSGPLLLQSWGYQECCADAVGGYPLLIGWIDLYYRPVMMGKRVAVHPVMMMIGILAGVPFMGLDGLILGPVRIARVVTG